jgi:phenylacetate-CoA ligase
MGSEGLEGGQREAIEAAFGCRVYTWYGHSERVVLGSECEQDRAYHQFPDYGILEVISHDQEHPEVAGGTGEIVGTGLLNRAMPLIRYRTGDSARVLEPECRCGRKFDRFDSVEGRWAQEFVVGKSGTRISLAALNIHGQVFRHVARYQYFQDTPGVLEIRVVPTEGFSPDDRRGIEKAYAAKVRDELIIKTVEVSAIPMTARGKVKRFIQELSCNPIWGCEGPAGSGSQIVKPSAAEIT